MLTVDDHVTFYDISLYLNLVNWVEAVMLVL